MQINFHDFVEYMDIVRNGSPYYKARLSFRIIDSRKLGWINRLDFVLFMNDLLQVWSSVTNAAISMSIMTIFSIGCQSPCKSLR